jgi:hypothetical protein
VCINVCMYVCVCVGGGAVTLTQRSSAVVVGIMMVCHCSAVVVGIMMVCHCSAVVVGIMMVCHCSAAGACLSAVHSVSLYL